jgi:hypothetical protein
VLKMNSSSISEQLTRQSFVPMECTIPPEMTIAEWRRRRPSGPRGTRPRPAGLSNVVRRLVSLRAEPCNHLHDSTTRYDPHRKLLTFLLVCSDCGIEKVVETMHYEPRFRATSGPGSASAGATIHQLPVRSHDDSPMRRAA